MQKSMENCVADLPFKYSFLDESLTIFIKLKESGVYYRMGRWHFCFPRLSWFVWIAALAAVNRTKEIGIRKVLGARPDIVGLLSKDFLKLVMIAMSLRHHLPGIL